ncbi:MAG: DEAD/DEAH box helicase [Candidatus Aenigmatarchaeota archaeon]
MEYFCHPLVVPKSIELREYQANILKTALERNTLCVLPTGLGKTAIAIMLAAERMERFPGSKTLVVAPTRPLCSQHQKAFQGALDLPKNSVILLTGQITPQARQAYYENAKVICATPQTIQNDLRTGKLNLSDFSLLVVDEVHRAVKKYAYPFVSQLYERTAKNPRILGLTASPGSEETKIKEICRNLSINAVEIRGENDSDVMHYAQHVDAEIVRVELGEEMKLAQERLKSVLKDRIEKLSRYTAQCRTKRDILDLQKRISRQLQMEKDPSLYYAASLAAETIKIWHALELLETQSIGALKGYFDRMAEGRSKATERMLGDDRVRDAIITVQHLYAEGKEHPKIGKLREIVAKSIEENKDVKIIVFSQYRDNIEAIYSMLQKVEGCRPAVLIGQAKTSDEDSVVSRGLKQKEQIDVIKDYEAYVYNVLITTSIGEEGLHLSSADMAIFYEPVPSEIRTIQRRGRVGRTKVGRVVFLITKDTRDEAYYYSARRKEREMKEILTEMREDMKQHRLGDF